MNAIYARARSGDGAADSVFRACGAGGGFDHDILDAFGILRKGEIEVGLGEFAQRYRARVTRDTDHLKFKWIPTAEGQMLPDRGLAWPDATGQGLVDDGDGWGGGAIGGGEIAAGI